MKQTISGNKVQIEHRYLLDVETKEKLITHLNHMKAIELGIPFGAWFAVTLYLWLNELKIVPITSTLNTIKCSINEYLFIIGMFSSCGMILFLWYVSYFYIKEEI